MRERHGIQPEVNSRIRRREIQLDGSDTAHIQLPPVCQTGQKKFIAANCRSAGVNDTVSSFVPVKQRH